MDSIELFTGAGGLALGTHDAGFRHRGLYEWDADACKTLRENSRAEALPGIGEWRVHQADVRVNSYAIFGEGRLDLVAGGAPCQPFSMGGKHQAQDDSRNMIPEFVRAVRELRPRAFIMENVKGLTRQSFRDYFEYIQFQLTYPAIKMERGEDWRSHFRRLSEVRLQGRPKDTRYNVKWKLLNAADYGVPQVRHRVFIVGFRADIDLNWQFPDPKHSLDALLWKQYVTGEYYRDHGIESVSTAHVRLGSKLHKLRACKEPPQTEPWLTVRDAIQGLPAPEIDQEPVGFSNHKLILGARTYPGHTGSHLDMPAKTLKAGVHGVPGGENMMVLHDKTVRYFTVRELARLQTFPDSWHFEGAWSKVMRQLGNAVPVKLAAVVADSVAEHLRLFDSSHERKGHVAVLPPRARRTVANVG